MSAQFLTGLNQTRGKWTTDEEKWAYMATARTPFAAR